MEATLRKTGALLGKDAKDLLKNPTMVVSCLMPIAFMALYGQMSSAPTGESGEFWSLYLQTMALCMTAGMVGSMTILYAIAEEKEKNTLRTLMLANVGSGQILASRALVSFITIAAVDVACYLVLKAPLDGLLPYLAIGLLGSVPIVMISLLLGMAARDQMTAGVYSIPIVLVAMLPGFAQINDALSKAAPYFPTGGTEKLLTLAAEGSLFTVDAVQPLMVTVVWIAASILAFALLYKRLSCDN